MEVLRAQAATARMFNYYIILHSNIRKCYYLSKSEVELRILRREIKELSDDLKVIVSGDSYFVVRSDLDEEDKNFLRTFTETSSSEKSYKIRNPFGLCVSSSRYFKP